MFDEQQIIEAHKDDAVLFTAFTGEEILYEFIATDNIMYWLIRKDATLAIIPAASLSAPCMIKEENMGRLIKPS